MAGKQARVLSANQVDHLLAWCLTTRQPIRNRALVLLSVKAGLRAGEIANLTWEMVVGPTGAIQSAIELRDAAAKNGSGRRIPLHPDLRYALTDLHHDEPGDGPLIRSERGLPMTPRSVVNWFAGAYRALNLAGCSSHSGRRTFITRAARLVHQAGGSLRDVQLLAGHQSIQTTQRYIDGDTEVQRRLVSLI
jgi:integrase